MREAPRFHEELESANLEVASPEATTGTFETTRPVEAVEAVETVKDRLMAHADMYRLPGDPPLTARDAERYEVSNERLPGQATKAREEWPVDSEMAFNRQFAAVAQADRAVFLRSALENPSPIFCLLAARAIGLVPIEERADLVRQALCLRFATGRQEAAMWIGSLPLDERLALVERGMGDPDNDVRHMVMSFVGDLPEGQLKESWLSTIRDKVQLGLLMGGKSDLVLLDCLEEKERAEAIGGNPEKFNKWRWDADVSSLYHGYGKSFRLADFPKSGSKITLIDAVPGPEETTFRHRMIVRKINRGCYDQWRRAYEDASFWQEKGFDYVPIEPIVKVKAAGEGDVEVYTRVLNGPNGEDWRAKTGGLYLPQIEKAMWRVREAIKELGIEHGHDGEQNFIVMFDRDERGEVRLERPPRVYMIDFDRAEGKG